MRLLANIVWMIFGGIVLALFWLIFGLILCITIIGIPFGKQCFKKSQLSLAPFGKRVELNFSQFPIANTLWAIIFGWSMALSYFLMAVFLCITIIGIPLGLQAIKFARLSFFPFGSEII